MNTHHYTDHTAIRAAESARRRPSDNWIARGLTLVALLASVSLCAIHASAFNLTVVDPDGNPVDGYRWQVEEDTTNWTTPGAQVGDSVILSIHNSYTPVVANGHSATSAASIAVPDTRRYYLSVLPDADHALSGAPVAPGQTDVTVVVQPYSIPTAQISIFACVDENPINNVWDAGEPGLGGCKVVLFDNAGQMMFDAFGNMLGTTYNPDGSVKEMGSGVIHTLSQEDYDNGNNPDNLKVGEALVKNLPPNKYGINLIPPELDDNGDPIEWVQTSTIEGKRTIDAWVKANEPKIFVEGFGAGFYHAVFTYVKLSPPTATNFKNQTIDALPWNANPVTTATGQITGQLRVNHFSRPPMLQSYNPGKPVGEGWVGLNRMTAEANIGGLAPNLVPGAGLIAVPCDEDGNFVIDNVPPGTYQLVSWDKPLDTLFGFNTVTVPPGGGGAGATVDLGNVLVFRWFGTLETYVFEDVNQNGFRDPGEKGIPEQGVNIRFRDGTVYQAFPTDLDGYAPFDEVFPFFKWLVVEVDFLRLKATGLTYIVDHGGAIPPDNGWDMPSDDVRNPQPQGVINPITGNDLSVTEVGEVLTKAMHLFLGQWNRMDFGKVSYAPGENGGISGIVFYAITRAEDDPRFAAGEPWEPGVPRVPVNLYRDDNRDGVIDDLNNDTMVTLADVDHYPFGNFPGPEDVDRNSDTNFDMGDAIDVTSTDSWDDSKPTGSIQDDLYVHGTLVQNADAFATWNQIRDGVFDGGYAFGDLTPGTYIVEAVPPPGYEIIKEEHKNVDFGDEFTPAAQVIGDPLLVPIPVGDPHVVPPEVTLFPGVEAPFAGQTRPLNDRKQVQLLDQQNAACDFFVVTEVPKCARGVGFVNNDLGAEFNQGSPNYGEKLAPSWIPISIKDWTGHEVNRVYCDEFGGYEFLLPSTYSVNVPSPTGVTEGMFTITLNDPIMPDGSLDPYYDPSYSVTPWTFNFGPGHTSYLDTPLVPVAAFTTNEVRVDTDPTSYTPVIHSVDGPEPGVGPVLCETRPNGSDIVLNSVGDLEIRNPDYQVGVGGVPATITRDYGFGAVEGTVTLDGMPLAIVSWDNAQIVATVPPGADTGRLMVTRGDSGLMSEIGVTLHIVDCGATNIIHVPADQATIQDAIDAATAGDLILVAPGAYNENIIMDKPVRLQGAGAGGVFVDGNPSPIERLEAWRTRVDNLGGAQFEAFLQRNPLFENEAPTVLVAGQAQITGAGIGGGGGQLQQIFGEPFTTATAALIDGFRLSGSKAGGGVFVVAGGHYLTVSNNDIANNQGMFAGGVSVGTPDAGFDNQNTNITIHCNKIHRNGGIQGAGGVSMNEGSANYLLEDNIVAGNFGRFNGGGVAHRGFSDGVNVIRDNDILFNEVFYGALDARAGDGAGIYIGGDAAGGTGTGNVTVDGNRIQGNMTGSGYGGGIRAFAVNGADVTANPGAPALWYELRIVNNIVVNNIAALSGAGISLQDVANSLIVNNTVAHNDSTAVGALAFQAGAANSTPQPAGIVSAPHSTALAAAFSPGVAQTHGDPTMRNNIVWENRSFYNDAALNGGAGGLAPNPVDPYWDLGVLGSTTALDPHLHPDNSVLTDQVDPHTGFDYESASNNLYTDPAFVDSYFNVIESATVIDEGGNNINTRFSPIELGTSDYHITAPSSAIALGLADLLVLPELQADIDGQPRPNGGVDAGADQYYGPGLTNAPPVALPDVYTARAGLTLNVAAPGVLVNDFDPEGDAMSAGLTVDAQHGALTLNADGSFAYTPSPGFTGIDTFTYFAMDATGGSAPVLVTLRVGDPVTPASVYTYPLDADPGFTTTGEWDFGVPAGLGGLLNGAPDPTAGATGVNVYGVNLGGDYSLAPSGPHNLTLGPLDLSGFSNTSLSFERWLNTDAAPFADAAVQVSNDGTNWTTVWQNGGAPVSDLAWMPVSYDISAAVDGAATAYVRWTYTINDFALAYSGWNIDDIEILGTVGLTPPVAMDDAYSGLMNQPIYATAPGVLANDSDADGDTFAAVLVTNVSNGVLLLNPNGSFHYTPDPGFGGVDTFTYIAANNQASAPATVSLNVVDTAGPNLPPVPTAPDIVIPVNTVGYTLISPNDPNPGDYHTFAAFTNPLHGVIQVPPTGIVEYIPDTDYAGLDAFTIEVSDQLGAEGLVTVGVMVTSDTMAMTSSTVMVNIQCPPDTDGVDTDGDGIVDNDNVCKHLGAGDGFVKMADGKLQYIFSFADLTDVTANTSASLQEVMMAGMLAAEFPAPTIRVKEGQRLYLNLTNVGMMLRPDLFDPHTVHWHGFRNAAPVFDGVPDSSISINMGATLTYFYDIQDAGTYMYHCHVEATEHMQMGMLGNLYVTPKQDGTTITFEGREYSKFAYNDGDGSTGYNVDIPVQIGSFDGDFHDASMNTQPLPFAMMRDNYGMLNGRGYPDTLDPNPLTPHPESAGIESQMVDSRIEVTRGDRILLRLSNLNVTRFYTLQSPSIEMEVVGIDARHLRSLTTGENLYYRTNAVTTGGGQAMDIILDTIDTPAGTYGLYSTNYPYLSNNDEDFGGMMTEIVVSE